MEPNTVKNKAPKPRRKTPFWATWRQRPNCSLQNAVALSLNIHPGALALVKKTRLDIYKRYLTRLKTASLATYEGGLIKMLPGHPDINENPNSRIISLASFVTFAMNQETWRDKLPTEFVNLKDAQNINLSDSDDRGNDMIDTENNTPYPIKRKAPDKFVADLIKLLIEVALLAKNSGEEFDVTAMPCTKEDFRAVAVKRYEIFDSLSSRTFDDYLSGLCQFKPGARRGDFYKKLFPEYIK